MESLPLGELAALDRREANAQARSKSSELRVETDELVAQTAARIERGEEAMVRQSRREPSSAPEPMALD